VIIFALFPAKRV